MARLRKLNGVDLLANSAGAFVDADQWRSDQGLVVSSALKLDPEIRLQPAEAEEDLPVILGVKPGLSKTQAYCPARHEPRPLGRAFL